MLEQELDRGFFSVLSTSDNAVELEDPRDRTCSIRDKNSKICKAFQFDCVLDESIN